MLTDNGLIPDPEKTMAIVNMPTPNNVKPLQEFLGMIQYLSKFLPQLLTITAPLRKSEGKNTQWCWLSVRDETVAKLKQLICEATVLRNFDPAKQVTVQYTIQCDASERGLGYSLFRFPCDYCVLSE